MQRRVNTSNVRCMKIIYFLLGTYFFSFGAFGFGAASARPVFCSGRVSAPASASYEARPSSFSGIDFWVLVRWIMCYIAMFV